MIEETPQNQANGLLDSSLMYLSVLSVLSIHLLMDWAKKLTQIVMIPPFTPADENPKALFSSGS